MARKITKKTRLRAGQLVFWEGADGPVVYQIAYVGDEDIESGDMQVALNHSPDHKQFFKENGVDLYTRTYKSQLISNQAEIINTLELICKLEHVISEKRQLKSEIGKLEEKYQKLKTEHERWLRLAENVKNEAKNGKPRFPCRVKR